MKIKDPVLISKTVSAIYSVDVDGTKLKLHIGTTWMTKAKGDGITT